MCPSFLKSPRLPISRTASSVCDSDNLDSRFSDPVDYPIGDTSKQKFSGALGMHRPALGIFLDLTDSVFKFRTKGICRGGITFSIPLVCRVDLGDRLGMESNASSGHPIVRGFGAAPPTKALSSLVPDRVRRCAARFLYSKPIRHLHRSNRPSCPADDRLALRAPRAVGSTLLSRLSYDWVSYSKFIRLCGCRQSEDRQADWRDDPSERFG